MDQPKCKILFYETRRGERRPVGILQLAQKQQTWYHEFYYPFAIFIRNSWRIILNLKILEMSSSINPIHQIGHDRPAV